MNVYTTNVTDSILGISVNDTTIDLFESQYPVPGGVSYNTYLIRDEKTAVMDTVDARATDAWMQALEQALGDQAPDYLVVSHVEPDHSANVARLAAREGKDQYGMVTDPRLLRAFRRDRRQVAAEYGKLSRKPPEAGRENQGGN